MLRTTSKIDDLSIYLILITFRIDNASQREAIKAKRRNIDRLQDQLNQLDIEKKAKEVSFSKEKEDSRKLMEQEKLARQQAYASSSKQRYQTESSNIASKYHIKSSELKSQHERNMYFLNKREEALKK